LWFESWEITKKTQVERKKLATTKTIFSFTAKCILEYPMADQDESESHFCIFPIKHGEKQANHKANCTHCFLGFVPNFLLGRAACLG
jgi:hypothetical protein